MRLRARASSISLTPAGFIMIPLLIRNVSAPFLVCFAANEYSNNRRIRFLCAMDLREDKLILRFLK